MKNLTFATTVLALITLSTASASLLQKSEDTFVKESDPCEEIRKQRDAFKTEKQYCEAKLISADSTIDKLIEKLDRDQKKLLDVIQNLESIRVESGSLLREINQEKNNQQLLNFKIEEQKKLITDLEKRIEYGDKAAKEDIERALIQEARLLALKADRDRKITSLEERLENKDESIAHYRKEIADLKSRLTDKILTKSKIISFKEVEYKYEDIIFLVKFHPQTLDLAIDNDTEYNLERLANLIDKYDRSAKIQLNGKSGIGGNDRDRRRLANERAETLKNYMIEKYRISDANFSRIAGTGEYSTGNQIGVEVSITNR